MSLCQIDMLLQSPACFYGCVFLAVITNIALLLMDFLASSPKTGIQYICEFYEVPGYVDLLGGLSGFSSSSGKVKAFNPKQRLTLGLRETDWDHCNSKTFITRVPH